MAESKPPTTEREVKVPWKIEETSVAAKLPQDKKETTSQVGQNIFGLAKDGVDAIAQAIHEKKESPTDHGSSLKQKGETPKVEPKQEDKGKLESFVEKAKEEVHEIMDKGRGGTPKVEPQPLKSDLPSENKGKGINILERAKEELEASLHKEKPTSDHQQHHKETHGQGGFDENTPTDKIKGPSLIQRAKEELEALIDTVQQSKKQSSAESRPPPKREDSCECTLAKGLQKICAPWTVKKDD